MTPTKKTAGVVGNKTQKSPEFESAVSRLDALVAEWSAPQRLSGRLLAASRDAVILLSGEPGKIVGINPAAERMFGYRYEEMLGGSCDVLFAGEASRSRFRECAGEGVSCGTTDCFPSEFDFRRKDGEVFPAEISALSPVKGAGLELLFIRDVGDRKKALEDLCDSQEQLYQAQKMKALGTLISGVAHEINNPINLIMFNVPLLKRIMEDFAPVLETHAAAHPEAKFGGLSHDFIRENLNGLLDDMEQAAERVASIVTDLKDFSRQAKSGESKPVAVNDAVESVLRLVRATTRKSGVRFIPKLQARIPAIPGNRAQIEQIIFNLVLNAVESVQHDSGEVEIETCSEKSSGRVKIMVRDNGRGVSPEIAPRIFEPFITDRQDEGGTGLGLSITYNLVKSHGGDIIFSSVDGQGTLFTVSLPVEKKDVYRVLIADDEAPVRRLLVSALSRRGGFDVAEAYNGTEACIKIGTFRPDLLILDLSMPETDGLEVCKIIRSNPEFNDMKIILSTGFPDDPRVAEILRVGDIELHPKPVDLNEFLGAVDRLLDRLS